MICRLHSKLGATGVRAVVVTPGAAVVSVVEPPALPVLPPEAFLPLPRPACRGASGRVETRRHALLVAADPRDGSGGDGANARIARFRRPLPPCSRATSNFQLTELFGNHGHRQQQCFYLPPY